MVEQLSSWFTVMDNLTQPTDWYFTPHVLPILTFHPSNISTIFSSFNLHPFPSSALVSYRSETKIYDLRLPGSSSLRIHSPKSHVACVACHLSHTHSISTPSACPDLWIQTSEQTFRTVTHWDTLAPKIKPLCPSVLCLLTELCSMLTHTYSDHTLPKMTHTHTYSSPHAQYHLHKPFNLHHCASKWVKMS